MRCLRALACFVAVSAPAPVVLARTTPPVMAKTTGEEEGMRLRWGVSGFGGKYFVAGTGGGIGGVAARIGTQMNRVIGFYGSPVLLIGSGASVSTGKDLGFVTLYGVGGLVDFTFSDLLFLAVGPELLRGTAARASEGGSSASAEAGTFFGLEARAGLAFGSMKQNERKAFTVGLDFHTIFTSRPMVIPMLALGFDAF